MLSKIGLSFFFFLLSFGAQAQSDSLTVYLIPGQGSDYRIYNNMNWEGAYRIKHIKYPVPEKGMTMRQYAEVLSAQIDTSKRFALIGVSLGGMLATEMSTFIKPEKVIIISSAKCQCELPGRYNFQKRIPVYKLVPPGLAKGGARILQPIVEPDRKIEKNTFRSMLKDKNKVFLRRTIDMIIKWERTEVPEGIFHIHGNNDHTIPVKNVKYDHVVSNGSHMMALTKGEAISKIINLKLAE